MNKEVTVRVIGTTKSPEGEENTIRQENSGIYSERSGKKYLLYYEKQEETKEEVKTLVTISGKEVTVAKTGAVNTRMVFSGGKKTPVEYETQYGKIHMDVLTQNLMVICKEESLQITIDYKLEMGEDMVSQCQVDIFAQ